MIKFLFSVLFASSLFISYDAVAQSDSIVLKDIEWDAKAPAGMTELFIPSEGAKLAGFIYKANGPQKHPTLLLLHGYPGNERNLDLAQVVRAHGWNVIYFDYRGSWASQGKFSFKNCVQDVLNVVAFCKKYRDSLGIDTSHMVLFGHSMGGWICLKALQRLPGIRKGFALSTWNIGGDRITPANTSPGYFVLNSSVRELFDPVRADRPFFNLANDGRWLAGKQIIMLDEHSGNRAVADSIRATNRAFFDYQVWKTDHPFTNKRVALMKMVLAFLDK
jgi:pimeloyl-ACP methyl ester carboxylesterase